MSTPSIDVIYSSLLIAWNRDASELRIVAHWTYYDDGMDPVTVIIYDIDSAWTGEGKREHWERTERRMATVQGQKGISDLIIDWTKGW